MYKLVVNRVEYVPASVAGDLDAEYSEGVVAGELELLDQALAEQGGSESHLVRTGALPGVTVELGRALSRHLGPVPRYLLRPDNATIIYRFRNHSSASELNKFTQQKSKRVLCLAHSN